MALYTGKTLDQCKSDYEAAQREYNSMLQGSGGSLSSVSSLEHAKKKLDLAAADYGQAQRAQNTGTAPSGTIGTKDTHLLNEHLATHQSQPNQGQANNSFGTYGSFDTPVLNDFLANHKATSPVNNQGYTSQRLENGMAFNSLTPLMTNSAKNYLGTQNTSDTNSRSSTQLFNELNNVKPFASNAGSNPTHIINTSTPIFNPTLNSASKVGTPVINVNSAINLSPNSNTGSAMDNMADTGTSSQNLFRGGYGNTVNTDTYRTTIDPSIIDADTADLKSLKSAMTEAYSHYDTLRAGQNFSGAYGIHIAGQEAQTSKDVEDAYQTYLTAEKAYNNAAQTHNDAEMAKAINADAATLNQLESAKNNPDFAQKSEEGRANNSKYFSTTSANGLPNVYFGTQLDKEQTVSRMTPDEQNTYAYYLATDKAKAVTYLSSLSRALNYRKASSENAQIADLSSKYPVLGAAYNFTGNLFKPVGLAGSAIQAGKDIFSGKNEPLDTNSSYFSANRMAQTSEKALIDKAKTPTGKWWTNQLLGVSNAVPIVAASLVSPELGLTIMSSEAAGDAAYSVAERGGTAAQATTSGVIVGGLQYLV